MTGSKRKNKKCLRVMTWAPKTLYGPSQSGPVRHTFIGGMVVFKCPKAKRCSPKVSSFRIDGKLERYLNPVFLVP